jgi:hypothetical protein
MGIFNRHPFTQLIFQYRQTMIACQRYFPYNVPFILAAQGLSRVAKSGPVVKQKQKNTIKMRG